MSSVFSRNSAVVTPDIYVISGIIINWNYIGYLNYENIIKSFYLIMSCLKNFCFVDCQEQKEPTAVTIQFNLKIKNNCT